MNSLSDERLRWRGSGEVCITPPSTLDLYDGVVSFHGSSIQGILVFTALGYMGKGESRVVILGNAHSLF